MDSGNALFYINDFGSSNSYTFGGAPVRHANDRYLHERITALEDALADLTRRLTSPYVYHGRPKLGSSGYELVRRERRSL